MSSKDFFLTNDSPFWNWIRCVWFIKAQEAVQIQTNLCSCGNGVDKMFEMFLVCVPPAKFLVLSIENIVWIYACHDRFVYFAVFIAQMKNTHVYKCVATGVSKLSLLHAAHCDRIDQASDMLKPNNSYSFNFIFSFDFCSFSLSLRFNCVYEASVVCGASRNFYFCVRIRLTRRANKNI